MPDLDVTEILEDPDFADVFIVKRRTSSVSEDNGRATVKESLYRDILGVVLAEDPSNQLRTDDGTMIPRNISVVTRFRLWGVSDSAQPDQLIYNGSVYTVQSVKLWTRFGAGFVKAFAQSQQASDPSPR